MTRQVEDNSSEEMRAARRAYCEHFMRFGELDGALRTRLEALVIPLRGAVSMRVRKSRAGTRCTVEGCEDWNIAKGLCRRHYSALAWQKKKKRLENERAEQIR